MTILDKNTILRYILKDDEETAAIVDELISRDECLVVPEVVAEIVFDLLKVYRLDREKIVQSISAILSHKNVRVPHKGVVETALRYFGDTKLDFVDCLMIGYAIVEGHRVFTFDKKLNKILAAL